MKDMLYSKVKFITIVALGFILAFCLPLQAATLYVSPSGNDSGGSGSSASPWKTLSYAVDRLNGGDTLILKDGIYSGAANAINNVPSGSAISYTTIRAENDFGAILDGTGSGWTNPITIAGRSYIVVQGLRIRNSLSYEAGIYVDDSDHIKLMKLSLHNAVGYENNECKYACPIKMRDVVLCLVEECFVSGRMRYGILIRNEYNSANTFCAYNIIRRCVVRWDYYAQRDASQPIAGISIYGTDAATTIHDILVQNCIVLDWNPGDYGTKNSIYGAYYTPHVTKDITYQGCIALNIQGESSLTNYDQIFAGFMIADDKSLNGNRAMYNCLSLDTKGPGICIEQTI